MKKLIFFFSLFLILPCHFAFCLFDRVSGIEDTYLARVIISPLKAQTIYVSSRNSLYRSEDAGKNFAKLNVFKDETVAHIFSDPALANIVYVATTRHLYKITDKTESLFSSPEEAVILTAFKYKGDIYVGTSDGLYVANEETLKWEKVKALGSAVAIYSLTLTPEGIFSATGKGVYYFKDKDTAERVFVIREKEETAEEESGIAPSIIIADAFDAQRLWLGTNKGIFYSLDKGKTWKKLFIAGIDNLSINCLAQSHAEEDSLYVAATKGFFRINLKTKTSKQIFEGIEASRILWITFSQEGEIYLATEQGLFKGGYFTPSSANKNIEALLSDEPSIEEVQQMGIRYNEVHPDKIKKWRNQLKVRALFPTINWSYDKTIYGTAAGQFATGPRDWGLTFGWDLGNFVWNSYEDDVDTRSRLNTQLRLDILDEINRVYFERLRTKRDMLTANLNEEELFQKQLRLKELTAILDGYTGGYFTRRTEELHEE
jgi:ligand-binding sensor domain-containing protein